MTISNGMTVRVSEPNATFVGTVISTDKYEDPYGNDLYEIEVEKIITDSQEELHIGKIYKTDPSFVTIKTN